MDFKAHTVIVTGGRGALGSEVVRLFLSAGARVAIPVRPGSRVTEQSTVPLTESMVPFEWECDVANERDVGGFVAAVRRTYGDPDILVHAAGGYTGGKRVDETTADLWDNMLSLNLRSAFLFVREVLPPMRERGAGRIVFISAITALRPSALNAAYAVSKRGILTLMEVVAEEVKGTGVTANAVAPSIMDTPANRAAMPKADTGRWLTTAEVAATVLYLCSQDARGINGATIPLRGGL